MLKKPSQIKAAKIGFGPYIKQLIAVYTFSHIVGWQWMLS
jgi:hypothetical protein